MEPILRAGETYALPRDWTREEALNYWFSFPHQCFIAEGDHQALGIAFLKPNQMGGGSHIANCGFMTSKDAQGKGIARAMCSDILDVAKRLGFKGIQFNFVVSSNVRAIKLWQGLGFETLARLPGAFDHPQLGLIDALVMFKAL